MWHPTQARNEAAQTEALRQIRLSGTVFDISAVIEAGTIPGWGSPGLDSASLAEQEPHND